MLGSVFSKKTSVVHFGGINSCFYMPKQKSKFKSPPVQGSDSITEVRVVADHEAAFWSAVDYIDACLKVGVTPPPIMVRHVVWRLKGRNDKVLYKKHTRARNTMGHPPLGLARLAFCRKLK